MHVILYVLDALRADHVGCYGYGRDTTPNIDLLASRGIVFDNCYTVSTWTSPVAATLLTGLYPEVHGARTREDSLHPDLRRLPEVLKEGGFSTLCVSAMPNVSPRHGFSRGFDDFVELFRRFNGREEEVPSQAPQSHAGEMLAAGGTMARADEINAAFFPWFSAHLGDNTFSLLWSIDPHVPYYPPADQRYFADREIGQHAGEAANVLAAREEDIQDLIDLYDDEIRSNDRAFGDLVEFLSAEGALEDTMIVVLADHGEAFMEHGLVTHGHYPYDEVLKVPLIISWPAIRRRSIRIPNLVELTDIFPTILESGLETIPDLPNAPQGHSLASAIGGRGEVPDRAHAFSDTQLLPFHNRYFSVRGAEWKYISVDRTRATPLSLLKVARYAFQRKILSRAIGGFRQYFRRYLAGEESEYLFNLRRDPEETENQVAANPGKADELRTVLSEWRTENQALSVGASIAGLTEEEDEELRRHLSKLGYL